jgi:hypothetical protein
MFPCLPAFVSVVLVVALSELVQSFRSKLARRLRSLPGLFSGLPDRELASGRVDEVEAATTGE